MNTEKLFLRQGPSTLCWAASMLLVASAALAAEQEFRGSVSGRPIVVRLLTDNAATLLSPSNGQTFSGTYKTNGSTIVVDFGFGKEIFVRENANTLTTQWQGTPVTLRRTGGSSQAPSASSAITSPARIATGTYKGTVQGSSYVVQLMDGGAFRLRSPSNGQHFSGTYAVKGSTLIADMGFSKEIFTIAKDGSLQTSWEGVGVVLRK